LVFALFFFDKKERNGREFLGLLPYPFGRAAD
jgi:hypothetical protein